ncbi:MAG: cation:proton antiporter [archaeon]
MEMLQSLVHLVYIAMILLLGTLCTALAKGLRTSNVFFLILAGMIFGGLGLISFSPVAVITICVLALVMIVFDSTNKLKFKELRSFLMPALRLTGFYWVGTVVLLSAVAVFLFDIHPLLAFFFSSLMFGIDPAIALTLLGKAKRKAVELLEVESLLNQPITLIISLMLLRSLEGVGKAGFGGAFSPILSLFLQVGLGLVIGLLVGSILLSILRKSFMGNLSHLMVLTAVVITFVISEWIGGSGVLAVVVLGLMFGNFHVEHKIELRKFACIFTHTLEILVFILIGTILIVQTQYLLKGTLLFLCYLAIRLFAVQAAYPAMPSRDKLLLTLTVPKGIDVSVIILLITTSFSTVDGMDTVLNLSLLFVLYSIVLATVHGTLTSRNKTFG